MFFANESTDIMNDNNIIPSYYEDFMEGALAIVAENDQNFANLMEYIGIHEATTFAQTGEEVVYTEGMLSGIGEKVKKFIDKVIAKIKSLFKRVVLFFDQRFKKDKDFVNKYKKRIQNAGMPSDFEFSGYPFPENVSDKVKITAITESVISDSVGKDGKNEDSDVKDYLVKAVLSTCNSYEDFRSDLFEATHGSDSKEDLSGNQLSATTAMNYIYDSSKTMKDLKKIHSDAEKALNDLRKTVDKQDMSKASDDDKVVRSAMLRSIRYATDIIATAYGAVLQAHKDKNAQCRALCAKLITKGGTINESAITHPAYDDFFDGFEMI